MEFLKVEEVAEILRSSKWFVYQNYKLLGGFKIGKLVRFEKTVFEERIQVLKNDSLQASGEMALRLLQGQGTSAGQRVRDESRRKGGRSRSPKKTEGVEREIYKYLREQT